MRLGAVPRRILATAIFGALNVGVAYAQTSPPVGISPMPDIGITGASDLTNFIICNLAAVMFWILTALAVVFVIVAAYKYLTSGGDTEKVSGATKTLTYAAVAVAVAILAKVVPVIVADIFGYAIGYTC